MGRNSFTAAVFLLVALVWAIAANGWDVSCPGGVCPPRVSLDPVVPWTRPAPGIVDVYCRGESEPASGVYIGVVRGRGITLTCWHVARRGVDRIGRSACLGIHRDKLGYDLAALVTEPLNVPSVYVGEYPRQGIEVTIYGRPLGRLVRRVAQVLGYCLPDSGQRWGHLLLNQRSQPGDSGGGVFNAEGQLIGLIWGTASDNSGSSVAVPSPAIRDFVARLETVLAEEDSASVPTEPAPPLPSRTPPLPVPATVNECGELRELIRQNAVAIAALAARAPEPGPVGPQGPPGESFRVDQISDEQLAVFVARLPPIHVRVEVLDSPPANPVTEQDVYLGGELPLRLYLNPPGKAKGAF